ncbi:hypothetical protein H8356DRAFT_1363902 [Neocallimastix lanati (nom. inval.)]|nr:hypothetical protein H8356DRAFT_1363902 [Neocallimastix sp. JGI-2020a]
MERIILNEKNYNIWSNLIMGELEYAKLEHTVIPNDTNTEKNGESTLTEDFDTAFELLDYINIPISFDHTNHFADFDKE